MDDLKLKIIIEFYEIKVPFLIFFGPFKVKSHKKVINKNVSDIKGLKIKDLIAKPYKFRCLTLNENDINEFKENIKATLGESIDVLKRLELVITDKQNAKVCIYNEEFNKLLNLVIMDFEIPNSPEDIIQYFRSKRKFEIFYKNNFEFVNQKQINNFSSSVNHEYIGYTGQDLEKLNNGKELECAIICNNNEEIKDYIFIDKMKSVLVKDNLRVKEFYIISEDLIKAIEVETFKIAKMYKNVSKVRISTMLFDLNQIKKVLKNVSLNFDKDITLGLYWYNLGSSLDGCLLEFKVESNNVISLAPDKNYHNRRNKDNCSIMYVRSDFNEQWDKLQAEKREFYRY